MEVVKITKKVYEVRVAINKPFTKFGRYKELRELRNQSVQRCCFNCSHKFSDDDDIYVVMLKGTHNHLFCKECNDKALADLKKGGEQ